MLCHQPRCFKPQVVFQEVPDEISLAFTVLGCPLRCEGCHSQDSWDTEQGEVLSKEKLQEYLERYQGMVTCVLFFGGEWHSSWLCECLEIAREMGFKTCLYTGKEKITKRITQYLTFLKTGPWLKDKGGLANKNTNQKLIHMESGNLLSYRFWGDQ